MADIEHVIVVGKRVVVAVVVGTHIIGKPFHIPKVLLRYRGGRADGEFDAVRNNAEIGLRFFQVCDISRDPVREELIGNDLHGVYLSAPRKRLIGDVAPEAYAASDIGDFRELVHTIK